MGGVDRPICSCGLSKPLNRAVRLRRHVTFFRHDDDGFVVTAELRARCPRSPEPFRHADVSDVRERCAQEEDGGENDNGAHSLPALGLKWRLSAAYRASRRAATMARWGAMFLRPSHGPCRR